MTVLVAGDTVINCATVPRHDAQAAATLLAAAERAGGSARFTGDG